MLVADGFNKLPKEFLEKMGQFRLFNVDMCKHTVAEYVDGDHKIKEFNKTKTKIATDQEVILDLTYLAQKSRKR